MRVVFHFMAIITFHSFLTHIYSGSQNNVFTSVYSSPAILLINQNSSDNNVIYKYNETPEQKEGKSDDNVYDLDKELEPNLILIKNFNNNNNNFWSKWSRYRRETTTDKSINPLDVTDLDDLDIQSKIGTPPSPHIYHVEYQTASIDGLRLESVEKGVTYEDNGASIIISDVHTSIRLFGKGFTNHTVIRFATELKSRGADCDDTSSTKTFPISHISKNVLSSAVIENVIFPSSQRDEYYYVCIRENSVDMPWIHQGPDAWLTIKANQRFLPFWVHVVLIFILLLLSGLFAGLTLGLLALDRTDLRILANTGSETERNYAKTILPLRTRGNYLLCSLVLGNVLVNSTLTILMDDLTSGIIAVICSTGGIVIFGEIIPQAVCSRNGLAIGAKTVWVTKFLMFITFPLSYTISILLDKILGEEIGIVYNREKLKELIALTLEHNDLETDEVNIISGALTMKKKTVDHIMTRLEDIFMLQMDGILDFETLTEIRRQGYSRIPIYKDERSNIVSILFTKDLVFVDSDDGVLLRSLSEFYNNKCFFLLADTTLDIVFREFKESNRGHMAFVQRINRSHDDRDPFCETIGLVTLEDVIEELIQSEIVDETDIWVDNRSKKRIISHKKQDFSNFVEIRNSQKSVCVSPQLALAAFQFLSTVVEPFKSPHISETVLYSLLKKNIIFKIPKAKDNKPCDYVYQTGKPSEYFVMILEGKVQVQAGIEKLQFEAGPFTYFGADFLLTEPPSAPSDYFSTLEVGGNISSISPSKKHSFLPDYSLKAVTDVVCVRMKYSAYRTARMATNLEKIYADPVKAAANLNWQVEVDNVLTSVDEDTVVGTFPRGTLTISNPLLSESQNHGSRIEVLNISNNQQANNNVNEFRKTEEASALL